MARNLKLDVKFWINIVTLVALVVLVVISWEQIVGAFRELRSLNISILVFLIPLQGLSYFAVARLYKDFFDAQGDHVPLRTMYKVALELNFVNHVFPSGGVSGFSYLSVRMKQLGVSVAKSTLAQILRFALTFLSFIVILLFGMVMLAFGANTSPLIILICSTIIFATIAGAAIGVYIITSPSRIKSFVSWLPKFLNYVGRYFKRGKNLINMRRVEHTLEELHEDYKVLSKDMRLIKWLFVWSLVINIAELLTIYSVYVALGSFINPGALIIAYAVANFAGLIAVLPGGIGVYEGLMTATLTSAGVNRGLALSATVIYRVLTMVFFLPIGYFYYHKAIQGVSDLKQTSKLLVDKKDAADPDTN